jgi:transcriptional regulator with XRE-family HTH domain
VPPARRRHPAAVAFGARIRARRTELGMTQRVLAERAGMDWSYVAQTERGERNVALLNILRLAEALEMDLGDLTRGLRLDPDR